MSIHCNLRPLAIAVVMTSSLFAAAGCHRDSTADASSCLTDTKLVDQNGNQVSLASLKGKPLVVDFIYTSCPGECKMETAKLTNVALRLGPDLGSKGHLVDMMLIGPDGRLVREYNGEIVKAQDIVDDVRKTLNKG